MSDGRSQQLRTATKRLRQTAATLHQTGVPHARAATAVASPVTTAPEPAVSAPTGTPTSTDDHHDPDSTQSSSLDSLQFHRPGAGCRAWRRSRPRGGGPPPDGKRRLRAHRQALVGRPVDDSRLLTGQRREAPDLGRGAGHCLVATRRTESVVVRCAVSGTPSGPSRGCRPGGVPVGAPRPDPPGTLTLSPYGGPGLSTSNESCELPAPSVPPLTSSPPARSCCGGPVTRRGFAAM